ncbi:MAG: redoxin family protein [Bacteroidota bacterium]
MQPTLIYFNILILTLLFGCGDGNSAQSGAQEADSEPPSAGVAPGKVAFKIEGTLTGVSDQDSIYLYDQFGAEFRRIQGVALDKSGEKASFEMSGKVPEAGVYVLNYEAQAGLEVILGEDDLVTFEAEADNIFGTARFESKSPRNADYHQFQLQLARYQQVIQQNNQKMQQAQQERNQQLMQELQQQNQQVFQQQGQFVTDYLEKPGVLGKTATVFQYEPYDPNKHQMYSDDKAYYIEGFMSTADFEDPQLAYIPVTSNKFQSYGQTLLMQFGVSHEEFSSAVDRYIKQTPEDSKLRKLLLYAAVNAAANSRQHPSQLDIYVQYAKRFTEEFPDDPFTDKVSGDVKKYGKTMIGSQAPEIVQPDPDGNERKLSDVKGKVILLDFWASWCGPCRRENPRVVKLYEQYKEKGFEIFSVSLDKDKAKWLQAIQADKLMWDNHVSDLKGWQNAAAQNYGVSSIPFTLLLDEEGRIIAKNVRGPALDQKLKELLGS